MIGQGPERGPALRGSRVHRAVCSVSGPGCAELGRPQSAAVPPTWTTPDRLGSADVREALLTEMRARPEHWRRTLARACRWGLVAHGGGGGSGWGCALGCRGGACDAQWGRWACCALGLDAQGRGFGGAGGSSALWARPRVDRGWTRGRSDGSCWSVVRPGSALSGECCWRGCRRCWWLMVVLGCGRASPPTATCSRSSARPATRPPGRASTATMHSSSPRSRRRPRSPSTARRSPVASSRPSPATRACLPRRPTPCTPRAPGA